MQTGVGVVTAMAAADITQKVRMLVFYRKQFPVPNPDLVWVMKGSGTGGMRVLDMERIEVLLVEDRDPLRRPSILIAYDFWFLIS